MCAVWLPDWKLLPRPYPWLSITVEIDLALEKTISATEIRGQEFGPQPPNGLAVYRNTNHGRIPVVSAADRDSLAMHR